MQPKSRTCNIVVQDLENEILIYDLQTNKANCLNKTLATVWKFCDGKRTIPEIIAEVSKELKKPVLEDLVYLSIKQLKEVNLLEHSEKLELRLENTSRREVIKKIGMTSMVALPIISSITVPKAVDAQSGSCQPVLCIAQGQDVCAGCVGQTISVTQFNSNNGTCTLGAFTTFNINCTGFQTVPSDVQRN